jgi:hypothetical protein
MLQKTQVLGLVVAFALGAASSSSLWPSAKPSPAPALTSGYVNPTLRRPAKPISIRVKTTARSYFARDAHGALIPEEVEGRRYFRVGEGVYSYDRMLSVGNTALIVMDPWEDAGSQRLNQHFNPIITAKLLPLITKAIDIGMPVIVLTNAPLANVDYSNKVHPAIKRLAEAGMLRIIFHQDTDGNRFSAWLKGQGIDSLIYSGFASNMCVIGRDLGMIPMSSRGFRLFFVPEASAAIEFADTWETGDVHRDTTSLISQWLGELIGLSDFLDAEPIQLPKAQ